MHSDSTRRGALIAVLASAAAAALAPSITSASPVPSSSLYTAGLNSGTNGALDGFDPSGNVTTYIPSTSNTLATNAIDGGRGVVIDSAGDLFVSDNRENRIYEVQAGTNTVYSLSLGAPASTGPTGLAYANNTLYVSSYNLTTNSIGAISLSGANISADSYVNYASTTGPAWGLTADSAGNLYATNVNTIEKIAASGNPTIAGTVTSNWGTTLSNANYYYDTIYNGTLYVASHNGSTSSYIATYSLATGGAGTVYAGATATNTLNSVYGIVADANGQIFIVDDVGSGDYLIQQVVSAGATPSLSTFVDLGAGAPYMGLAIAPEPASIGLLGVGVLALSFRRPVRKRA